MASTKCTDRFLDRFRARVRLRGRWLGGLEGLFYARASSRRSFSAAILIWGCSGCYVWVCSALHGEENNSCKTLYGTLIIVHDLLYHWDLGKMMDCFIILHFVSVDFPSWKSRTFHLPMLHKLGWCPIEPRLLPFSDCEHSSSAYAMQLWPSWAYPCKWYRTLARCPRYPDEYRTSSSWQTLHS